MSLSNWSAPFQSDDGSVKRKKIMLADLDDDASSLADFKPMAKAAAPAASMLQQDSLSEKLDYMIMLLEEKKDEKTENVTEEVILYMFLGVFVIFVLDTFVKTGKYHR
jgi:hypothetical protein